MKADKEGNLEIIRRQLAGLAAFQKAVLDSNVYSIIATDPYGIILLFNKRAEQLLGYSAAEMIGLQTPAIIHDAQEVVQATERLNGEFGVKLEPGFQTFVYRTAQTGVPDEQVWTYVRKDGSRFPVLLSITAIRNERGQIDAYLGIAKDITQRVEAERAREEALQKQAELLRELESYQFALDQAALVSITDTKGIIKAVNRTFCEVSQFEAEELIGSSHRIVNSGYHDASFFQGLWDTIRSGRVWRGEIRNRKKDGSNYWVDAAIVPFLDEQGKPYQYVAIRNVITEKIEARAKLESLNAALMATNKELDDFAYIISHDLKAPLRAINNLAEWIAEDLGTPSEEVATNLKLLRGRVHRMENLINGVLQYSRIGRKRYPDELVEMKPLLEEVISGLPLPKGCQVALPQQLPTIAAPRVFMEQLFGNLLSNALKYTDKSVPSIEVLCEDLPRHWRFAVRDDGPGIAEEFHQKVFGIFQTLQARDKVESTGIGLAIVKKIVEDRGGKVGVLSAPGQGATFFFTWPKKGTIHG